MLVEVGLTAHRQESRGLYDRFRDRVMFPIRDVQSRSVGFGGRIMPESPYASRAPKYYNSAETPLFSKSELLYGLDKARHAGATVGYLAVVEGYTDVMMAHQCGVPQVVATMGTALNARHVHKLRHFARRVVLVFDADAGGDTGVDRALEIFASNDVDLAIWTLITFVVFMFVLKKLAWGPIIEGLQKRESSMFDNVAAAEYFYARLFAGNPDIRGLFPTSMTVQRERMFAALGRVIWSLDTEPECTALLRQMGREHRRYGVLDKQLSDHEFVAGALSVADFAILGWAWRHPRHKVDLADFPNVKRWYEQLMARPAVKKGMEAKLD